MRDQEDESLSEWERKRAREDQEKIVEDNEKTIRATKEEKRSKEKIAKQQIRNKLESKNTLEQKKNYLKKRGYETQRWRWEKRLEKCEEIKIKGVHEIGAGESGKRTKAARKP